MPRGTTLRNVRVAEEPWRDALSAAERRGATASDAVRTGLEVYAETSDVVWSQIEAIAADRGESVPHTIMVALGVYALRHSANRVTP